MEVRQLSLKDCPAVANLETQLFESRFDAEQLRSLLEKPAFYGAVLAAPGVASDVHAYCLSYITPDSADIIAIGTHGNCQRSGFGQAVMRHMIEVTEQRHVERILLEVASDNCAARQLYHSFGFVEVGCRKNYYQRGKVRCDALIMVRQRVSAFS